jgi:predicted TIM-barrel fold metal-dependent hydrolase
METILAAAARSALTDRLAWLETDGATLTLDGDCHLSDPASLPPAMRARIAIEPNYFHGRPMAAEELLAELELSEVDAALCWQNPAATAYPGDEAGNEAALWAANGYLSAAADRSPRRIIPAGWTDPRALGVARAAALAERCVIELGCAVVKLNPAQNGYPIDSDEVLAVVRRIVALGAVPAFHVGADTPYTPAEGLARVLDAVAPSPVIAVHLGGGGASYLEQEKLCHDLRQLLLARPTLFAIHSAKRDVHIESDLIAAALAGEPFDRLAAGSDAPYGRVAWHFGGARQMLATLGDSRHPDARLRTQPGAISRDRVRRYLGGNLARLLAAAHRRVLSVLR